MNERNEKWLDEQLKKTVDCGKVEFDSEQWKRKYPAEYKALVSRAGKQPAVRRFLFAHWLVRAAAVVAIGVLVIFLTHQKPVERTVQPIVMKTEQSPAMLLSRLSLMRAYERGGMDAVDEQCEKAFKLLGQKNMNVTTDELLNENNGKEAERKEL
jgi:hypothetical protein